MLNLDNDSTRHPPPTAIWEEEKNIWFSQAVEGNLGMRTNWELEELYELYNSPDFVREIIPCRWAPAEKSKTQDYYSDEDGLKVQKTDRKLIS